MKTKTIILSVLFTVLNVLPANAQEEDIIVIDDEEDAESDDVNQTSPKVLELNPIDIVETPEQQVLKGARPAFAQTITMPRLQSVNDWLESANGVYGDASGKGTRSVIVRGFETRQINFQFDGVPLDTGYDGMTGLDVMPMNWISAGRIAHADATPTDAVGFGGKIDLYAFNPGLAEAAVETSLTGVIASAAHGMSMGPWHWAATVGGQYSNGFYLSHAFEEHSDEDGGLRDSSWKKGGNFLVKAGRTLGDWGDFEILAGWAQAPRGVPTGVNTGYRRYWEFTSWRVAFTSAKLNFRTTALGGQFQVWATDQGNTLEAYDSPARNTQNTAVASTSVWQDDDYGGRIDLTSMPWSLGNAGFMRALLRTDLRYQYHDSHEIAYQPEGYTDNSSSRFYFDIRPALEWQITSAIRLFASGDAAGAKAIDQDIESTNPTNQPKLEDLYDGGFSTGLDYNILSSLDLNLRAARRLRMPTLKEQFRSLPGSDEPIPTLDPERAWDFEAEIHWKPIDEVALTIGGFDTEIRDLIEFKYINNTKISHNVSKSRIAGTDIALALGAWAGFSFDISYHYLYAYDLSQDHELNDRPAHNLRFAVHYAPIDALKFTVSGQYESKRRTEAWLSNKYAWMGDVFLLGAEIEYQMDHFSMYLRGTNLLDYNYSRAFGYPEPGVNVVLGAKIVL